MARMYPERLRSDTKSHAEQKLYQAFAVGLPDEFRVFHSVSWQVPDLRHGATDGEADFAIAHPDLGFLVLEVKGGHIRYDGVTGHWFSNETPIQDPFDQAKNNKYSLLKLLKGQPYWQARWLDIGHAVAFPDVTVVRNLRLDAPRETVMDAADLSDILSWVRSALEYWRGQSKPGNAPGEQGIRSLTEVLSPSWDLRLRLGAAIRDEETEIRRLTEEQYYILDLLGRTRRAAISGCAGSGKTTLAVEKATRLARQGSRVLLTCFNRFLADYLATTVTDVPGVGVISFHALALDWCRRAGLVSGRIPSASVFFEDTLPELLMQAVEKLGPQFDALVVDEG